MYDKVCTKAQWHRRQNALKTHLISGFRVQTNAIQSLYEQVLMMTEQLKLITTQVQVLNQDILDMKQLMSMMYQKNL